MSVIDREIVPGALREVFKQLVEKGGLNISHPSRSSMDWALFHWGHPNQCLDNLEKPRVFFYGLDFSEDFGSLCRDVVSVSMVIGVQVDCSKYKSAQYHFETLWYHIRRVLGRKTGFLKMNFDVSVTDSLGTTRTLTNPRLHEIGITNPEVVSSVSTDIQGGKILRYQGNLTFDLHFARPTLELGEVGTPVTPPTPGDGIGSMTIGSTFIVA